MRNSETLGLGRGHVFKTAVIRKNHGTAREATEPCFAASDSAFPKAKKINVTRVLRDVTRPLRRARVLPTRIAHSNLTHTYHGRGYRNLTPPRVQPVPVRPRLHRATPCKFQRLCCVPFEFRMQIDARLPLVL